MVAHARVLVFGRGFLGTRFAREIPGAALSAADITDGVAVRAALQDSGADAVINAAGKTGRPNVDWCELHMPQTYRANVVGALVLAEACADAGAYLLHLGSGCVFSGESPQPEGWREDDFANPISYYARTKYAADLALSPLPNVAIVRIRMPVDEAPHPRNLITKLAGYRDVIDVENSVTFVPDLVRVVEALLALRPAGVLHATNPGVLSHREMLALYREHVDPAHRCTLIAEGELLRRGLVAKARSSCVLAGARLEGLGVRMRPAEEALATTMRAYARA